MSNNLYKYINYKIKRFGGFKRDLEQIKLFQISLGFVLSVILFTSGSILTLGMIFTLIFPLKKSKYLLYLTLIISFFYVQSWQSSVNTEINRLNTNRINETAEVIEITRNSFSNEYVLKADSVNGLIYFEDQNSYNDIREYDKVKIKGILQLPENKSSFNYVDYLKSRKIFYILNGSVELTEQSFNLLTQIRDFKYRVIDSIESNIKLPESSVGEGVLIGITSNIPKEIKDSFALTGTSHILSVSGFNFTIILIAFLSLSKFIGRRKVLYSSTIFIFLFLIFVGVNNLTAVRATIMILIYIVGMLAGRRVDFLYLVSITCTFFLLDYPLSWTNLSLQLSFGSLLGIYFLSKPIISFLKNIKLPEYISEVIGTSLAAILGVLPFTINTFGTLSIIAPLVNIIVLPLVPFVMLLEFCSIITDLLKIIFIGSILYKITEIIIKCIIEFINWASKIPFASTNNTTAIFLLVLTMGLIILFVDYKSFLKKFF